MAFSSSESAVGEVVLQLEHAQGAEAYVLLRRLFKLSASANAEQVEAQLRAFERDSRRAPEARVYASTLISMLRARRGDLFAAREQMRALGYIDRWFVAGPFHNEGKSGLGLRFEPEESFDDPLMLARTFSGKGKNVRFRALPSAFGYGWLDLGSLLRPSTEICAYALAFVAHAGAPRPVSLWVGATGAFKLFWNGREVLSDDAYRGHDMDRVGVVVPALSGPNQLVIKSCGESQSPLVSLRVGDHRGGVAQGITVSNAMDLAEKAAANVMRAAKEPFVPRPKLGPLAELERRAAAQPEDATALFALATYLVESHGDDPSRHHARDLARRAAELEPTVERLLLSARLAEDRNQRRVWLEKARALDSARGSPSVDLLLAFAQHAQQGPGWRAAFPYVNRILRLDPNNAEALRAKVGLYNEAGLPRTALQIIDEALLRAPESIALLDLRIAQLRALGRDMEADLEARRRSAQRADDRVQLGQMLELAVMRGEPSAAEFWAGRLLELTPDSAETLGFLARAYQRLGQPERALGTLRRALELAPDHVNTLNALATLYGRLGDTEQQVATLRRTLEVEPQNQHARRYLEHLEPAMRKPDEAYAWPQGRFLALRHLPARGESRRTLRDLTVTTVFENGLSRRFKQVVFQPLTDAAAAEARQYVFTYESEQQRVELRGAKVFRADGRVDEAIDWGEAPVEDPSIAMYTSARYFYVQFPRLERGDVVELRYRVDDIVPKNPFADYFGTVEYLQDTVPVHNAEYVLIAPKSRMLHVEHTVPGLKESVSEDQGQRIHHFKAEHLPAVVAESHMPPINEVLGFIHASTYRDWKQLGSWYWGWVKDQFDLDAETRKLAERITQGKTTELEKVKAIYGWVVKNTRYVALEFGIYGYKPRRCVQTVARGWGDCKDKATVIVTLLRALGIPSTMVLVRSQQRGAPRTKLASLALFDHAIAYVPGLDLYLDGTAEFAGSSELPLMDREAFALLLNEGHSVPVVLPSRPPEANKVTRRIHAALKPNGDADVMLKYSAQGMDAPDWRRRYEARGALVDRLTQDLGQRFPGLRVDPASVRTNNLDDLEVSPQLDLRASVPGLARPEGHRLSLRVTPEVRFTATYAAMAERKQDISLLSLTGTEETFVVELPPGYNVETLPESRAESGPFGRYGVKVERRGRTVRVESHLYIDSTRITPSEYEAWSRLCTDVDALFSQRLVVSPSR